MNGPTGPQSAIGVDPALSMTIGFVNEIFSFYYQTIVESSPTGETNCSMTRRNYLLKK